MFFKRLSREKRPPAAAPEAVSKVESAGSSGIIPALLSRTEAQTLSAADLRRTVDASSLGFKTTDDLTPADGLIGQERALEAIKFGLEMKADGFNIFVLGPQASGKHTAVRALVSALAAAAETPADWVYAPNFDDPLRPRALSLPAGRGPRFARGVREALTELSVALPAAFRSEDYRARRRVLDEELRAANDDALAHIFAKAAQQNIAVLRTPLGFGVAPMHDGKVVKSEVFNQLPATMRRDVETRVAALEKELQAVLANAPEAERARRTQLAALNADTARHAVEDCLDALSAEFAKVPEVAAHVADMETDIIANCERFAEIPSRDAALDAFEDGFFGRYLVTVMASSAPDAGSPVLELAPVSAPALTGFIEAAPSGRTVSHPTLRLRPGALHRANGGLLLIEARDLLASPESWQALKRALKTGEIAVAASPEAAGASAAAIVPQPVPLAVKIVLFGDGESYQQLEAADAEFARYCKVQADFDDTIARSSENERSLARLIASIVARHALTPVDAAGVARLLDEASRIAENRERLTLEVGRLTDILQEADHWARAETRKTISADDIRKAIEQRARRTDRARTQAHDAIERGVVLVDTSGAKAGQVNGLSFAAKSGPGFARPVRITARVHLGGGRVTDIEREVSLGGPLHSKGVMILWGYLAGRYADDVPLALAASLVFEQSYEPVDGDSASAAELFALLSALADAPLRQDLAVTGSVNQWGEIQAVGGVNEKIEGFFDLCAARGLTGTQGVLIPEANRQHLMLREDVVAAVKEGRFSVSTIKTADEGLALLTGLEAGQKTAEGFGAATLNGRVAARLRSFAEKARLYEADGSRRSAAAGKAA